MLRNHYVKQILGLCLSLCLFAGCSLPSMQKAEDRLTVVATLFPQYDFARAIAGDKAEITLLLSPGAESHSFEPTPNDIISIYNADLFIYTGKSMEAWATGLVDSLEGPLVLDLSSGRRLHSHEGHHHDVDPHIFTNPVLAMGMAEDIKNALCSLDEENADYYSARFFDLQKNLQGLDTEFQSIAAAYGDKPLIFGGRFAFGYFIEEYGFCYDAAYDSCSSETEPSAAKIASLIDKIQSLSIPVVYYEELADPKTARLICEETGAKPLLLHSCHNLSKEEFDRGETYLSLMAQNAKNLKEGLN